MRIAQVAPLYESVPPKLYGGTERVVSYLTEELVGLGHEVTLFASGDSVTSANLVAPCERSLRLDTKCVDQLARHYAMLADVLERSDEFDIIHFHVDYLHFPISKAYELPQLTTLHGRLDIPDLDPLYRKYRDMPLASISFSQRRPLCWANWIGNVYHGLAPKGFSQGTGAGKYLAFLGRISPEKRVDRAIQIALETGMPLKIAAKVDRVDREYYETQIKPLLSQPGIEYLGEIAEQQKSDFLGNAYAYLFPIDWPEPFGLTMIEAMACGTPTVAFDCGSVREVLPHGRAGIIVNDMAQAVEAVSQVQELRRSDIRREFERRFTASRMARDYVRLYENILSAKSAEAPAPETDTLLTI